MSEPEYFASYQSAVHSQTLPIMLQRPRIIACAIAADRSRILRPELCVLHRGFAIAPVKLGALDQPTAGALPLGLGG